MIWNIFLTILIGTIGILGGYLVLHLILSPFITYGVQAYLGFTLTQTWLAYAFFLPMTHVPVVWSEHLFSYALYLTVAVVGFIWLLEETDILYDLNRTIKSSRSLGFFGVVFSFIRARKEKLCPVIELVD